MESIEKAKKNYNELAKINITTNGSYISVSFHDCHYDEILTMREYENHVIDLMVSKNGI